MDKWNLVFLIITLSAVFLCGAIIFFQSRKTRKIMLTLNRMLESAMDGNFTEDTFNESLLSSVESKFNRYLAASSVSAHNLSAEKEKIKELLADISHQTKTPIANILLYAQLLEEQELPAESKDFVALLNRQAEKLSFLITSLVKLSRLETGVLMLCPDLNAVTPMLKEVIGQFESKALKKGIRLTADTSEAFAVFDMKWTTEALCNLVDNAIKYTPDNGSIHISVKAYDLFCRIDIADTGIGISEEEQANIFARFYRSGTVSGQDGVGIGLYLTRQILAEQGGYIKVSSALGKGAVFSVFLPQKG